MVLFYYNQKRIMSDFELVNTPNIGSDSTCLSMSLNDSKKEIIINVKPPQTGDRQKTRVICLLDRSQSMIAPICYTTEDGKTEDDGLTRMDLAVHTFKTLVKSMPEDVELGLISFNGQAKVLLGMTQMTDENKTVAIDKTNNLSPTGLTNLWEPLQMALNLLKEKPNPETNDVIIMLTDGEPTRSPVRGEIAEMKKYIQDNFTESTPPYFVPIGFTNGQNSSLLNNMANLTNEMSYYISDASMMGTVFINTLSYILNTAGTNSVLTIESEVPINPSIKQSYNCQYETNKVVFNIGSFGYGLNRNIIIPIENDNDVIPQFKATLSYRPTNSTTMNMIQTTEFSEVDRTQINSHFVRINFTTILTHVLKSLHDSAKAKELLMSGLESVKQLNSEEPYIKGIESDYYEAIKATDEKYIDKWGKHYIMGLLNAHSKERCTNFKDEGVKFYVSPAYEQFQKNAETVFNDMDIEKLTFVDEPVYTSPTYTSGSGTRNVVIPQRYKSSVKRKTLAGYQRNYYNASNGCFAPQCMVTMGDGTKKRVDQIQPGDFVKSANTSARVRCVVRFECDAGKADMCNIAHTDLIISPYHPVFYAGNWKFPYKFGATKVYDYKYVYDFVLEGGSTVFISDIVTCTFGHGLKCNDVVKHNYFGTERVLDDLSKLKGWSEGYITMPANCFARCIENQPVTGLKWNVLENILA